LRRRRYSDPDAGSCFPLDPWLDRLEDTVSVGLRELACRINLGARNFDKAAENLKKAAQVDLSGEFLRQIVESEGKALLAKAQAGQLPVDWTAEDCQAHDSQGQTTEKTRVYLGADGFMVPTITQAEKDKRRAAIKAKRCRRGKKCRPLPRAKPGADQSFKEFKVVTLYDDPGKHRLVSVTRGDCQAAGRLMRRDAGRIGLDRADDKVAVVDGSDWIKNQLGHQSLPLDAVGLDFYHLSENVHKARRAVYGESAPQEGSNPGNRWASELLSLAKHQGYEALDEALCAWLGGLRGAKRQAGLGLLGYVMAREEMIGYPEFLAAGRQIGSGPTESMCKATRQRIKGCGMRWDADNAESQIALEALDQSGGWDAYWDACLAQAV